MKTAAQELRRYRCYRSKASDNDDFPATTLLPIHLPFPTFPTLYSPPEDEVWGKQHLLLPLCRTVPARSVNCWVDAAKNGALSAIVAARKLASCFPAWHLKIG